MYNYVHLPPLWTPIFPLYPPSQQIICIVKGLLCYCQLLFICPYVASYIFLSPFTSSPCIMCNFVHLPPLWTPISPPLPTHPTDFWKVKELLCHCQLLIHFSLCCIIYKPLYVFDHFLVLYSYIHFLYYFILPQGLNVRKAFSA